MWRGERCRVAALSLLATWLFFFEYFPPFKRVHIPYDLEGFQYPLLDYAFQSLRAGRLPQWDPTIYCGLSFVGNVQAALFYPPNWAMFAANLGRPRLAFKALEALVIAHFWLAFFLCYLWLRGRRLATLPSALGAAVLAFGGQMISQVEHFGVTAGYAWLPLGFRGIDQSGESGDWRPLWKVAAASALCFLAGYPPQWVVSCVCMAAYAAAGHRRGKEAPGVAAALGVSLLVVMIQLLPALDAVALRAYEQRFGPGYRDLELYVSFLLPNYFGLGLESSGAGESTIQYQYLGAPVLFGLAWLAWRRNLRNYGQALTVAAVCAAFLTNAFGIPEAVINRLGRLSDACRAWHFLAGISAAAALLAATALDDFLRRGSPRRPRWSTAAAIGVLAVWSLRQLWVWLPGGVEFASGWRGAFEAAVTLAAFALGICSLRAEQTARRRWLAAALLVAVGVDYKVFGTSRRFSAALGDYDEFLPPESARGVDDAVYRQLRAHPEFRVALDHGFPGGLRHVGLTTPQGFDPLLPAQYKRAIETYVSFRTDREFEIDPRREDFLRRLGVRYFLTIRTGELFPVLSASNRFRLLEPAESYFQVFEYLGATPAYYWDRGDGSLRCTLWTAERREFVARSETGGRVVLVEQFFPGWQAAVDGEAARIEHWGEAFQAVAVGPGEHHIRFEFRPRSLRIGALVTVVSLMALWLAIRVGPPAPGSRRWQGPPR